MDYAIPGNDDAFRAIRVYLQGIADAIIEGRMATAQPASGDDDFVEVAPGPAAAEAAGDDGEAAEPAS